MKSKSNKKKNKKNEKLRQIVEKASHSKLLEKHAVDSEDDDVQRFSTKTKCFVFAYVRENIVFTSLTNALTSISSITPHHTLVSLTRHKTTQI